MANPFYAEPPNLNSALQQLMQGYQFTSGLRKQGETEAARREAGDALASGGDTRSAIGRLLGIGDVQGAQVLGSLGKADTTDEIKEYNLDMAQRRAQGMQPVNFGQWKTALKQAGATRVNTNVNTGEKSYDQTVGKSMADRFVDMQKTGQSASGQIATLDILDKLSDDPNFYSGPGAERFALPLRQAISKFGGDPNSAASMETFRALSNKSVLDSMGGSLGTGFSNADRDFVVGQVPSLANTKEGNKQLIEITRKVAKRNQEIAAFARDYAAKNGGRIDAGFDAALSQWAERNPLFPQGGPQNKMQPTTSGSATSTGVKWRIVQ